ncbi:Anti-sigma-I factor RsgI2 [Pseudoclavibacter triregionum]|nr:Anti-sigma-I factor RsgI2 [Pseudoclavibacter triregionum]
MANLSPIAARPGRRSRAGALLALLALAGAILTAFMAPSIARAAQNPGIVVTTTSFEKSDSQGNPIPDEPLTQWDWAKYSFAWDASNANPQPGDSFNIQFPAEFKLREEITVPLRDAAGTEVGSCDVKYTQVTCTFNDQIAGKTDIKGTGSAVMQAIESTTTSTVTFHLNGQATVVPLPGDAPIGVPNATYTPWELDKWEPQLMKGQDRLYWSIAFGGEWLATSMNQSPEAIDVTFVDTLGSSQTFELDPAKWVLYGQGTKADPAASAVAITNGAGTDFGATGYGSPKLQVSVTGNVATIRLTGKLDPNANYTITYETLPDTGVVQPGVVYRNSVEVAGQTVTKQTQYVETFTITVEMKDGFGNFGVTKLLDGTGASAVPAGTQFQVLAAWTLPDGKTPADYAGWTPPANPIPLTVTVGQTAVNAIPLPVGTVVTLTEDPNTANPAATAVTWGQPTFSVDGGAPSSTATFTIANQKQTAVRLTNVATPVPTPTPTPTPTDTPTPTPTDTPCPTPTPTDTPTPTPTDTPTPTPTDTPTPTPTDTPTPTPTDTPTPTPTDTPTPTPTDTPTPTPTDTPTPTPTPTDTPTPTPTPTDTPTPTPTPTDTPTPTPTPTDTPTPTPTPTDTPTPTPTDTPTPTPTPTDTPTPTPTSTATAPVTPTPTATAPVTVTPTSTGTPLPPVTDVPEQPGTPGLANTGAADLAPLATAASLLTLAGLAAMAFRRRVQR